MLRVIAIMCLTAQAIFADGGTIQLRREVVPFIVTVFCSSVPLPPGGGDVSVLVQDAVTLDPVLDARLWFHFDSDLEPVTAMRDRAQNRLLYAVNLNLDHPGAWPYTLTIERGSTLVTVGDTLIVAPPAAGITANLAYAAPVPAIIALFMLHQFLLRRRMRTITSIGRRPLR